jgi:hypothetical protein
MRRKQRRQELERSSCDHGGGKRASARGRPRERASRGESSSLASSRRQRARAAVWRSAPGDMTTCVHLCRHRGSEEACHKALGGMAQP